MARSRTGFRFSEIRRWLRLVEFVVLGAALLLGPVHANAADDPLAEAAALEREIDSLPRDPRDGRSKTGLALAKRAVQLVESAPGDNRAALARALLYLGTEYYLERQPGTAIPILQRSLSLSESVLAPTDAKLAAPLQALAAAFHATGEELRALPLYLRQLDIEMKAYGVRDSRTTHTLEALALLFVQLTRYDEAEVAFRRLIEIAIDRSGSNSPDVAGLYDGLATVYLAKGQYGEAKAIASRSLAIREQQDPPDPQIVFALRALGTIAVATGQYDDAIRFHQRELRIAESSGSEESKASVCGALGRAYLLNGDPNQALPYLGRALKIHSAISPNSTSVAVDLAALATIATAERNFALALQMLTRAAQIAEHASGRDSELFLNMAEQIAEVHVAMGDGEKAVDSYRQVEDVRERVVSRILTGTADEQKRQYFATLEGATGRVLSFVLGTAHRSDDISRLGLDVILRRKGRVIDIGAETLLAAKASTEPEVQAGLRELRKLRHDLAAEALSDAADATRLRSIERSARDVEERLLRALPARDVAGAPTITTERAQAMLGRDQALVEFASYRPHDPTILDGRRQWGPTRYAAYVLRSSGSPDVVDLGPSDLIDDTVKRLRTAIAHVSNDFVSSSRELDQLTLEKIRPLLGSARDVFLSPDGRLSIVPFAALIDRDGHYALETLRLTYLSSGRELLRATVDSGSATTDLVVAAPNFGSSRASARRRFDFSQVTFEPLPGTLGEATEIGRLLPGATVLTGDRATKSAIVDVHRPRILHIATHGFFLEDVSAPAPLGDNRGLVLTSKPAQMAPLAANPLLRAGLAFSGANERAGGHNGILTALEATMLDLSGTKLVTLSACDTGLGEVTNGDDIYGLRRALTLAGVESQVISLWSVNDQATAALMSSYYARLLRGGGRSDSLREAQLELLSNSSTAHPFYWAAFYAAGNPRTLDGAPAPPVRSVSVANNLPQVEPGARGCACRLGGSSSDSRSVGAGPFALAFLAGLFRRCGSARGSNVRRCHATP